MSLSGRLRFIRPYLPPVFAGAVFLVVMDLWLSQPKLRDPRSDLMPVLPIGTAAKVQNEHDVVQQLLGQLEQPEQPDLATENTASGMSPEQQAQQQGLLKELYSSDKVYRLTAIARQNKQYKAILSAKSVDTGSSTAPERHELQVDDELDGYQVIELNAKRLTLAQGARKVWLELFVPATLPGNASKQN